MTSPSLINLPTAATGPAKGSNSASAQPSQEGGLMGCLTRLLQGNGLAAAQNPLAGTQGAAETAQTLAAKISDLMAQNGGAIDAAALSQFMPADMAQAIADKLAALQQFSQLTAATPQEAPIIPTLLGDSTSSTLTSDLTGASAATAQDEDMLKALAEQLNAIEPGEDAAETDTAEAVTTVKDDMMATLLALQSDDAAEQPAAALTAQTSEAAAKALRTTTAAATPAKSPLITQQEAAANAGAQANDADTSAHVDINDRGQARADKQAPAINTPAASLAAQMQQVAPQPLQNNNTFSGMLGSSLGTLNSLLSGDSMGGGGFDQGFGGQHGLAGDTSLLDGMSADGRLSAGNGSFTTYLNAAAKGAGQAATTQMVGMQISRNANAKVDTFTMLLEPADLGALEVRMSFSKDGKISAKLIADKPETLSMLQRDSMQLERILQQSGLDVDQNALSFDLRDGNQQSMYDRAGDQRDNNMYAGRGDHAHRSSNDIIAQLAVQAAGYISQTGVNIMV